MSKFLIKLLKAKLFLLDIIVSTLIHWVIVALWYTWNRALIVPFKNNYQALVNAPWWVKHSIFLVIFAVSVMIFSFNYFGGIGWKV
mgnify:CR=1 FL=1